jgi:hypothetical protein
MKKTAVEWLFEKMTEQGTNPYWDMRFIQAKEMEKEQSIDFARLCLNKAKDLDVLTAFINVQQYYNETYGNDT